MSYFNNYDDNADNQEVSTEAVNEQVHKEETETSTIELKLCQKELEHSKERYTYLVAEFDNYKKRTEKEKSQWMPQAQLKVLEDILPVIDNFERALKDTNLDLGQDSAQLVQHLEGFEMIFKSLKKVLDSYGVREITDTVNFNPEEHEAVMRVQSETHQSGDIVEVFEKGYKFKDYVIRPAKVSVAQ